MRTPHRQTILAYHSTLFASHTPCTLRLAQSTLRRTRTHYARVHSQETSACFIDLTGNLPEDHVSLSKLYGGDSFVSFHKEVCSLKDLTRAQNLLAMTPCGATAFCWR
jgi:hypothetical protein